MGGQLSATTCSLSSTPCSPSDYCDLQGCCPRKLCAGSLMFPMNNITEKDKMQLLECKSHRDCDNRESQFPNSYCSAVDKATIPYAKSFRDEQKPQTLLPTKFYSVSSFDIKKDYTKTDLEGLIDKENDIFKPCKTSTDCGPEEFCDDAVAMDKSHSANVEALQDFAPRLCFPAPRCAGRPVANPSGVGIKTCSSSKDCKATEFCDVESNSLNPFKLFANLGICCAYDCTTEAKSKGILGNGTKAYARYTQNLAKCNSDNDCEINNKQLVVSVLF
ncbi:hypothetical protein DICVIV_10500 [Dictyocaulus viviparus]|uniref:Uncharacterized protein n=1 Tax=Dictyocaulus viviparus TaxID=29172 RepID=A0A0D8XIB4_DICVI|nr:hypothetical protein DICVIV_10500 [Dictyocaulus viviparus]